MGIYKCEDVIKTEMNLLQYLAGFKNVILNT